ncbi:189_t:CDS:1, partial [Entrophospora sp. SA101]
MLEGFFGTIRELGSDSSIQTLQVYGYAIMTLEIQSHNYGSTICNVIKINTFKMK